MKFYDVTYKIIHRRIFKVLDGNWLKLFCKENEMEIIECIEINNEE